MSINVKTFNRLSDAAGALSSERGARFLGGGTLLMRAINEADPEVETIVRSTDPSFLHLAVSSGRIELGAGVTMAALLAERELAFLHPADVFFPFHFYLSLYPFSFFQHLPTSIFLPLFPSIPFSLLYPFLFS